MTDGPNLRSLAPLGALAAAFAVFAGFSLPHLADPPIGTHGWRQTIAVSEARLYAQGQPFLYPRAEGCGAEPGLHMGSEFPLYAWTMGKLGGASGINLVGRLIGLLSALALMLATFVIVRHLFQRWSEPYRSFAAAAAGSFFAVSPLFRFYGISFVPDLPAHALALLGIALLAGPVRPRAAPLPLGWGRLAGAAALIALGALTKMIVVPHLALAGLVLLERSAPAAGLSGLRSPRPWLMGALLLAIVAVPVYLWYWRWVPVLKQGGCEMVWLPEKMDDTWKHMTFTDPEWRHRMSKWGREDLLGPAWPAVLAGIPLALFAGWRGAIVLVWALGCAAGFVRLGWHTKQHDYDFLLVLPAFAVGFGSAFGVLVQWLRPAERVWPKRAPAWAGRAAPYAALAIALLALTPWAHLQSRRHFYTSMDEVGLQTALDKVLPPGEPLHYFGGKNDPRIPYFANRRSWGIEYWEYCQRRNVKYPCSLETRYDRSPEERARANGAPCLERGPAVMWPEMSMVCSITNPQTPLAEPRLLEQIARSIRFPADKPIEGLGRLLGSDPFECHGLDFVCAGNLEDQRFLDLYLLPERAAPPVEVLVDGKPVAVKPEPRLWRAGSIIVARIALPDSGTSKVEIRASGAPLPVASN